MPDIASVRFIYRRSEWANWKCMVMEDSLKRLPITYGQLIFIGMASENGQKQRQMHQPREREGFAYGVPCIVFGMNMCDVTVCDDERLLSSHCLNLIKIHIDFWMVFVFPRDSCKFGRNYQAKILSFCKILYDIPWWPSQANGFDLIYKYNSSNPIYYNTRLNTPIAHTSSY